MIANAVVDIWKAEGVFPVPKYEDDLKVFRTPSSTGTFHDGDFTYDYDRSEMLRRIAPLGVPWHDEKGDDHFLFVTTFIGFRWDIPQKLVSLPDDKRLKFHERVRRFLNDFQGLTCSPSSLTLSHLFSKVVVVTYLMWRRSMAPSATSPLCTLTAALAYLPYQISHHPSTTMNS